ncbi:MAG: DUF5752 family protein, partial [Terriglobia bacterium]
KLASRDIRDYLSVAELQGDLWRLVHEYGKSFPHFAEKTAFEPFYFCEAIKVTVPLGMEASTLEEFVQHLERLNNASFHFHFITSRLRLHLRTNDFSSWSETSVGLPRLAKPINQINIYTHTIESAREKLLALAKEELVR